MGVSCSCSPLKTNIVHLKGKPGCKYSFHSAIRNGHIDFERQLVSKKTINTFDAWGLAPLHLASEIGDEHLVQNLLNTGADVNVVCMPQQGGAPPLLFAASNGRTDVVRILLDAGAFVDATDDWGCTALFKAATYNHTACVKLLLEYGANPNKANKWGAIPLQYAAHQGHYKVVRIMTKHGCDVTIPGEESVPPPIVAAAMRGHHKCVAALLDSGVNVNFSYTNDTDTALNFAIKYCQHALNEFTTDSTATIADRLRCIKILINAGAEVSPACVELLCTTDDRLPIFAYESTQRMEVLLSKMVLTAFPSKHPDKDRKAMGAVFREISMTLAMNAPLMSDLIGLLCSAGFNPSESDMDAIGYALINVELESLQSFRKNPRRLMDLSRLAIRSNLPGNVLSGVGQLPLPKTLKDYIALKNVRDYSL